jgi:hypothetical protein
VEVLQLLCQDPKERLQAQQLCKFARIQQDFTANPNLIHTAQSFGTAIDLATV